RDGAPRSRIFLHGPARRYGHIPIFLRADRELFPMSGGNESRPLAGHSFSSPTRFSSNRCRLPARHQQRHCTPDDGSPSMRSVRSERFLFPLAAAVAAAYSTSAGAQDGDMLPTVVVREIMPDDIGRTPGAAARLTGEQIRALRPYSMHDALGFVPGVRTIDDDAAGRRSGIGIRGAPPRRSRKTLLLEDGTPINASTYLDSSAHYTPPMERLESVDVLKASGQIVHGPLNNHGIVNFRNKRPTAVPETSVEIAAGTLDTLKRHVLHRRMVGSVGVVASYTGMDADGTFDVEDTSFDDFYGSVEWHIDDTSVLGASFTYFEERSHYDESNLTPIEFAIAPRTKLGRFGQEHN